MCAFHLPSSKPHRASFREWRLRSILGAVNGLQQKTNSMSASDIPNRDGKYERGPVEVRRKDVINQGTD